MATTTLAPKGRWIAVTVGVGLPAFALGPVLFPPSPDFPAPVGAQLPLLMGVAAAEALAMGLAVAFLLFGWPLVRRIVGPSRSRTIAAYLATAWLGGNWWLHDNLHIANGANINGLIAIDYLFHTTLIVAAVIVGWQLLRSIQEGRLRLGDAARPVPAEVRPPVTPRSG
jgi:hypothetical protein